MSAERENFGSLAEEIDYQQEVAEQCGQAKRLEAVEDMRAAIQGVGLSAGSIRFRTDEESSENGKIAMGSYEASSDQISTVGTRTFFEAAKENGMSVRECVTSILRHEITHRDSRKAKGAQKVDNLLAGHFGEEAIHATEEAAASIESGSDRFDAYDKERSEAGSYANKLGTSITELNRIRVEGDAEKLEELIYVPEAA